MTIIRILALGLALGAAATAAQAQSGNAQNDRLGVVIRQDSGLDRRMVLARELVSVSTGPNFAKEIERAIVEQIADIGDERGPEATWMRAYMPSMMTRMVDRMINDLVPVYADVFTEAELQGQIDFFTSPVGRSVATKTVALAVAHQEVEANVTTIFVTEFQTKYCAQFDCGEESQTAAKSTR